MCAGWLAPLCGADARRRGSRYRSRRSKNRIREVKATIANLVTPHLFKVVDLANQAQAGGNIDWHLRDTVARTIDALGHQYNARDLLSTYVDGLQAAARETGRMHSAYSRVLQAAATQATSHLDKL
jgi:hypothetical protein